MVTREAMYEAIDRYIDDCRWDLECRAEEFGSDDVGFREISYCIWAADKLKQYLDQNPGVDLCIVTQLFIHKMCDYSCMSSSGVGKHLFSVAETVGCWFMDEVLLK